MESHDTDLRRSSADTGSPVSGALPNRAPAAFDVFISYNSTDRPLVTRVVRHLKRNSVDPWFDQWNLTPGGKWQEEMAAGLLQSSACAVFIGRGDLGAWTRLEMSVALNRAATEREFRLFPVLLPGLEPFEPADLPPFLATRTWVDLRDGPVSERRLQDLINAVHGVPFGADVRPEQEEGPAPYQGLEAFDERHARFYFGRAAYIQRLVEKLKGGRFVAVVGPSGSGKSSLVRAGLLPRLRAGGTAGVSWRISVLRPGAHPLAALAGQLHKLDSSLTLQSTVDQLEADERTLHLITSATLADEPQDRQVLVVVDQCEELFTLCQDAAARTGFMNALHYACAVPGGRTAVVLTLRADFYARLAEFPRLAQLVQSRQLLVGGPSDDELRQIIEEPARVAGLEIESGLVETVLADVNREPGALPLLEHALLETWRRRRGRVLTLEGYQESGGVRRGLAERAEALYGDLTPEGQDVARRLLLRLTQPGEGTEDTRRRTSLHEVSTGPDRELVEKVVRRFVAERLLVMSADEATGEQRIEVSHEALIRAWPRLHGWIDADRAGLLVHRRLTFAAQEWQRLGRDSGVLYSGSRLAEALSWRDRQPDRLNRVEDDFLQASAKAEHDSRTARRRRLAGAFVALIAALTVISGVALVAVQRGSEAARQRDLAISRQLAASAVNALTVDPPLSLALALRAMDTARTAQAEEVLRRAVDEARGVLVLRGEGRAVLGARFLPGQRRVVTASDDGRLRVWDLDSAQVVATIPVHTDRAFVVRPAPDGKRVVSAGRDGVVAVTELTTGASRVVFRASPAVRIRGVVFSADGRLLAAAASDGTVRVLDAESGRELAVVDAAEQPVNDVAFSPDARVIAIAGEDGSAQVRLASNGALQARLDGHHGAVASVRFNPAGDRVITAGADGTARLWDAGSGVQVAVFQIAKETLFSAEFDPDGERIVTSGWDGAVRVWDLDGIELAVLRGHQHYVFDAMFDGRGDLVLSAGQDGTVRLWRLDASRAARSAITGVSFGSNGRIVSGGADGHVRVWDTARLHLQHDFAVTAGRSWASFSADGRRLVTAGESGDVHVMEADSGRELARLRPHSAQVWAAALDPSGERVVSSGEDATVVLSALSGAPPVVLGRHKGPVYSVQFSPDGKSVLSGGAGGAVRLWDLNGGVADFTGHEGDVLDVAFSRDGSRLGSAGADGTVRVWDRRERRQVALLRGHEGAATSVRFSPDGSRVVTTGEDGTIKVWDATSARLLLTRRLFEGSGSAVDFSNDGAVIVSASEADGVLRTSACEVCGPVDQVLALARSRPVRTLTPEEEQRFAS